MSEVITNQVRKAVVPALFSSAAKRRQLTRPARSKPNRELWAKDASNKRGSCPRLAQSLFVVGSALVVVTFIPVLHEASHGPKPQCLLGEIGICIHKLCVTRCPVVGLG